MGLQNQNRALLFSRSKHYDAWENPIDLSEGSFRPDGFGRSVGISDGTIVVGTNVNKVYVFTTQLVGITYRTEAVPFVPGSQYHSLNFDGRRLRVGSHLKLCMDMDGEDHDHSFIEMGLSDIIVQSGGPRSTHAEIT